MKKKLDAQLVGLIFGLVAPLLVFFAFYQLKYNHLPFSEFVGIMAGMNVIVQVLSICAIINLLVFFIFMWTHHYLAARGVILATFIYAIGVVIYKLT